MLADGKRIVTIQGTAGDHGKFEDVYGGDAGDPGTYGCDQVIYVDGLFNDRVYLKGDYSNYLLEDSIGKDGTNYTDDSKCKTGSIITKPDLYARRSPSYTVFTSALIVAAVVGTCLVAAPIAAAGAAVLPVLGLAGTTAGFFTTLLVGGMTETLAGVLTFGRCSNIFYRQNCNGAEMRSWWVKG